MTKYNRKFDVNSLKKKWIILPESVQFKDENNFCLNWDCIGIVVKKDEKCYLNCRGCIEE